MQITCSASFVKRPEALIRIISWDEVSEADGGQRDEAVVERVQVVPVRFEAGENRGRNQEKENDDEQNQLKFREKLV